MTNQLQQLLAASALIVTCERIASSGILSESEEASIRQNAWRQILGFPRESDA